MARIVPDMVRLQSYRTVYGLVAAHVQDERLRQVAQLPSAPRRRQPVHDHRRSTALIASSSGSWGVHFPIGGTGALVRGLVGAHRGAGRHASAATPRSSEITRRRTAARRACGSRAARRIAADVVVSNADSRLDLPPPAAARGARAAGPTGGSSAPRYSMSLFVWYFGTQPAVPRRRAPHDPARAALQRAARRHLRAQGPRRRLQPLPAPPDRDRPVARAAGLRRLLRALARSAPRQRHRLERGGRALPAARSSEHLRRPCCPGLERQIVTSRLLTPQDFQDRLLVVPRRGLRPGAACSRRAPGSGRTTRARTSTASTSSAPARIPAPACPACSPRRACSTGWCPMRPLWSDLPRRAADLAACRALLRARLARPSTPLASCCRARVREPRRRALRLLPPGRRRGRRSDRRPRRRSTGCARGSIAPTPASRSTHPVDRALADVVAAFAIPRELPDALLEGFAWDAEGRRYETLADAARLRGARGRHGRRHDDAADGRAHARRCWRAPATSASPCSSPTSPATSARTPAPGRLYLPLAWLREAGIDPEAWLAQAGVQRRARLGRAAPARAPRPRSTRRADARHRRAAAGVPPGHRGRAADYAEIGRELEVGLGLDSVTPPRGGPARRKLRLLATAFTAKRAVGPTRPEPPLEATRFLVDAVASSPPPADPGPARWWDLGERLAWTLRMLDRVERQRRLGFQQVGE